MLSTILITITVLSSMGKPVHDAYVIVNGQVCEGGEFCRTDGAGKMVFELVPGEHRVRIEKQEYKTFDGIVLFERGKPDVKIHIAGPSK